MHACVCSCMCVCICICVCVQVCSHACVSQPSKSSAPPSRSIVHNSAGTISPKNSTIFIFSMFHPTFTPRRRSSFISSFVFVSSIAWRRFWYASGIRGRAWRRRLSSGFNSNNSNDATFLTVNRSTITHHILLIL